MTVHIVDVVLAVDGPFVGVSHAGGIVIGADGVRFDVLGKAALFFLLDALEFLIGNLPGGDVNHAGGVVGGNAVIIPRLELLEGLPERRQLFLGHVAVGDVVPADIDVILSLFRTGGIGQLRSRERIAAGGS